jgi:hypothetical protein
MTQEPGAQENCDTLQDFEGSRRLHRWLCVLLLRRYFRYTNHSFSQIPLLFYSIPLRFVPPPSNPPSSRGLRPPLLLASSPMCPAI